MAIFHFFSDRKKGQKSAKSSSGESNKRSEDRCHCMCGGCCRHLSSSQARKSLSNDKEMKKTRLQRYEQSFLVLDMFVVYGFFIIFDLINTLIRSPYLFH